MAIIPGFTFYSPDGLLVLRFLQEPHSIALLAASSSADRPADYHVSQATLMETAPTSKAFTGPASGVLCSLMAAHSGLTSILMASIHRICL